MGLTCVATQGLKTSSHLRLPEKHKRFFEGIARCALSLNGHQVKAPFTQPSCIS
jgi:hypothetical protein